MKKIALTILLGLFIASSGFSQSFWMNYLTGKDCRAITISGQYLYAATYGNGLVRIDMKTGEYHVFTKANSGLPSNFLTSVTTDSEGNIWVGTGWMGLVKYDGSNWETLNENNSQLPSNLINTVQNVNGTVMAGTTNGLAVLNEGNIQVYNTSNSGLPTNQITAITNQGSTLVIGTSQGITTYNNTDWHQLPGVPNDVVTSLNMGLGGLLCVGTLNSGMGTYNAEDGYIPYNTSNSNLPSDQVHSVDATESELWAATSDGLASFDPESRTFTVYNTGNSGIMSNMLNVVYLVDNSDIWIGTDLGLNNFDGNADWSIQPTANSGLTSLTINDIEVEGGSRSARDQNIWMCNDYDFVGFDGMNWITYTNNNSGLPDAKLRDLAIDNTNTKWIASDAGLIKFDDTDWAIYNTANSEIPTENTSTVVPDETGNLWIGTYGGGIARFDGSNWAIYNAANSELPNNSILALKIDNDNRLWIGTYHGLAVFDGTDWEVYDAGNSEIPDEEIHGIGQGLDGLMWIGTYSVLVSFDGNNWTSYDENNTGLTLARITDIEIDLQNRLWFASKYDGMVMFDGEEWSVYNDENSPMPGYLTSCILIDSYNNKWIGSDGIAVYNNEGIILDIDERIKSGFPGTLAQNTPNPFKDITTIRFTLNRKMHVKLNIYEVSGKKIKTLFSEKADQGIHTVLFNAGSLNEGIYFYSLEAGNRRIVKRMVILK